jgi:hypothetical protein
LPIVCLDGYFLTNINVLGRVFVRKLGLHKIDNLERAWNGMGSFYKCALMKERILSVMTIFLLDLFFLN